jgi:hypothetical protein
MKKINWTPEQEAEINRVQRTTGVTRKSAIRKMRAAVKVQAKAKAQAVKTTPKPQPQQKSAGVNRSEGIRASGEEPLRFLGPWEGLIGIFPGAAAGSVQGVGEKS